MVGGAEGMAPTTEAIAILGLGAPRRVPIGEAAPSAAPRAAFPTPLQRRRGTGASGACLVRAGYMPVPFGSDRRTLAARKGSATCGAKLAASVQSPAVRTRIPKAGARVSTTKRSPSPRRTGNRILDAPPAEARARLDPRLRPLDVQAPQMLVQAGCARHVAKRGVRCHPEQR